MPVLLDPHPARPAAPGEITVGVLNNLGDAGLAMGERQLLDLLEAACGATRVRVQFFGLPSIERGAAARRSMDGRYGGLDALLATRLDGLFVTGAEPRTPDLRHEVFWPEFAAVADWARTGTRSTIWSCLAAHAAVLHLDGVVRRPLAEKCTGVFAVNATGDHPLLAGTGSAMEVSHSRWNGLDEAELVEAGYSVLTRGAVGVDAFVKRCGAEFVFFQGHPEYDSEALSREARRDLARWRADPSRVPSVPRNYFSPSDDAILQGYVAAGDASVPAPEPGAPLGRDHRFAATLMRNWLDLLAASTACAA